MLKKRFSPNISNTKKLQNVLFWLKMGVVVSVVNFPIDIKCFYLNMLVFLALIGWVTGPEQTCVFSLMNSYLQLYIHKQSNQLSYFFFCSLTTSLP